MAKRVKVVEECEESCDCGYYSVEIPEPIHGCKITYSTEGVSDDILWVHPAEGYVLVEPVDLDEQDELTAPFIFGDKPVYRVLDVGSQEYTFFGPDDLVVMTEGIGPELEFTDENDDEYLLFAFWDIVCTIK